MRPQHPIFIPSKGRWESRLTMKALDRLQVPYRVIVEQEQYGHYAKVLDPRCLIVLDPTFQEVYEPLADVEMVGSLGSGPARNMAWHLAREEGHPWHWVLDDNIRWFYWHQANEKIRFADGTGLRMLEDLACQFENLAMVGPAYELMTPRKQKRPPLVLNTRIYSCNLIRTDLPFSWRGVYNEDTILSLDMLKSGFCTIQSNQVLQQKVGTLKMKGGNTDVLYARGTLEKTRTLIRAHPDVAKLVWRYNRWHHQVDYSPFRANHLRRKADAPPLPDYGLTLKEVAHGH